MILTAEQVREIKRVYDEYGEAPAAQDMLLLFETCLELHEELEDAELLDNDLEALIAYANDTPSCSCPGLKTAPFSQAKLPALDDIPGPDEDCPVHGLGAS